VLGLGMVSSTAFEFCDLKLAKALWEIKQLMVILLKGNLRLLDSFLSTDLGKLWLKIANV
jgi:hypothetical protein